MTLTTASGTLCLAIALILAGFTPGKAWTDVRDAAAVVVIGWALCSWSCVIDPTPAQVIMDATGQYVDPYRIWALQDAVGSAWLASVYLRSRGTVSGLVGVILAVQLLVHALAQQGLILDRQPWIDSLFLAQLFVIAFLGVGTCGERIRNWFADHRRRRVGRGRGLLGLLGFAPGDRHDGRDRQHGLHLFGEQNA